MEKLDINLATVYGLLLPIASLWEQLGVALGLAPNLDMIKTNNHSDEQCLQAVLYHWENSSYINLIPGTHSYWHLIQAELE